jgi:hypothetical protein
MVVVGAAALIMVLVLEVNVLTMWHIDIVVPVVLHEQHAFTACPVLVAVVVPVFAMLGWNMHVHRFALDDGGAGLHHDGRRDDQHRRNWQATDIHVAEDAYGCPEGLARKQDCYSSQD